MCSAGIKPRCSSRNNDEANEEWKDRKMRPEDPSDFLHTMAVVSDIAEGQHENRGVGQTRFTAQAAL